MLRDILDSRAIQVGLLFFVLVVGGSLLYRWHVHHTTEREFGNIHTVQQKESGDTISPVATNNTSVETEFFDTEPEAFFAEDTADTENTQVNWTDEPSPETEDISNADLTPQNTVSTNTDFPDIPDGFSMTPVWADHRFPNYQKGDMPRHETLYRVLIKLWNQGDHDFINGVIDHQNGRVYPLYPDVFYVKWKKEVIGPPDNPITVRVPGTLVGTHNPNFSVEDFLFGIERLYPELTFIEEHTAGYDPETFLTDDEK